MLLRALLLVQGSAQQLVTIPLKCAVCQLATVSEALSTSLQAQKQESKPSGPAALEPWTSENELTPPVSYVEGMEPPTALSWLRRRGPQVPHGLLYKLFRQRQVRVYDGQKVSRVARGRVLNRGDVLLYPKHVVDHAQLPGRSQGGPEASSAGPSMSDRAEGAPAGGSRAWGRGTAPGGAPSWLTPERVRSWILTTTPDIIFINKPAGVNVQGYEGSLDSVMGQALKLNSRDEPKLVHRLDQHVSGVMAIPRNADAAAWLAHCFREKSSRAAAEAEAEAHQSSDSRDAEGRRGREKESREQEEDAEEEMYVQRMYYAFVQGELQNRLSARIRFPVVSDGQFRPAVTHFRVKAVGEGASWLELMPETGRRHQLRIHCAKYLQAPIIGDVKYGYGGLRPTKPLQQMLPPRWWEVLGPGAVAHVGQPGSPIMPILLHSRVMTVKEPGKRGVLKVVAPMPRYMLQLIEACGWPMPSRG